MKRTRLALWIMMGLLGLLVSTAWAEEEREARDWVAMLARQLKTMLNADNVLGRPLDFNGTRIIPIVRMGFDVSAAHRVAQDGDDDEDDKDNDKNDERGNSGERVRVRSFLAPLGLLIITKEGDVRVIDLHTGWRGPEGPGRREGFPQGAPSPQN